MNNRDRRSKSKGSLGFAVIAALLLLESATGAAVSGRVAALIVSVLLLGAAGLVFGLMLGKKKGRVKKPSTYHAERAKESARRMFMREEYKEEAVKCAHASGKDKYIQQLDNFLATGLIDKVEYRLLKERYERLNIADNIH